MKMTQTSLFETLKADFKDKVLSRNLMDEPINITCKVLSARQAIGTPDHDDYPIIKGREVMIEAEFAQSRGQAFTDEYENNTYRIRDLLSMDLSTNRQRASFVAGLNAVYRHLGLVDKTIHCRDNEPVQCAKALSDIFEKGARILLIGHQPRFLEALASFCRVRAIDLDADNVGKTFSGVAIEPETHTREAMDWCDSIFATGSTLVNHTIPTFIHSGKPAVFYGVTIAAPARILGLKTFCECGH